MILQSEVNLKAVDTHLATEMTLDEPNQDLTEEETEEDPQEVAIASKGIVKLNVKRGEANAAVTSVVNSKSSELSSKNKNLNDKKSNAVKKSEKDDKNVLSSQQKEQNNIKKHEKIEKKPKKSEKVAEKNTKRDEKHAEKRQEKVDNVPRKDNKKEDENSIRGKKDEKKNAQNTKERSKGIAVIKKNETDRYFKGHYNKDKHTDDNKRSVKKEEDKKHFKRRDEDFDHRGTKKSSLRRHWEKPIKKNYFRDSDEHRQFIRRKGKKLGDSRNQTNFKHDGKWRKHGESGRNDKRNDAAKGKGRTNDGMARRSSSETDDGMARRSSSGTNDGMAIRSSSGTNDGMARRSSSGTNDGVARRSSSGTVNPHKRTGQKSHERVGRTHERVGRNDSSSHKKETPRIDNSRKERFKKNRSSDRDDNKRRDWRHEKTNMHRQIRPSKHLLQQKQTDPRRRKRNDWRTYKRSLPTSDDSDDEYDDDYDDYDYYGGGGRFHKRTNYERQDSITTNIYEKTRQR